MIRALVVDDEPHARELLRSLLEREPDVEVVGEAALGERAIAEVTSGRPDILFLDIELPDLDGFAVLERLAKRDEPLPQVVFVTAYDEFALRAFEVHAVDYLLKPFDEERLAETLRRARGRLGERGAASLEADLTRLLRALERRRPLERLAVRRGDDSIVLRAREIDWLEAEENYVRVHVGERSYLARSTLQSLEERLDRDRFFRIHRSTVVNADRIRRFTPWGHGDLMVELADGTQLRASRRYRDQLDRVLAMLR